MDKVAWNTANIMHCNVDYPNMAVDVEDWLIANAIGFQYLGTIMNPVSFMPVARWLITDKKHQTAFLLRWA